MSDEKLRTLERRWKETGAVEDEAAYLLERVRAGDLPQERLDLAGYCGHEAAGHAAQVQQTASTLAELVDSVTRYGGLDLLLELLRETVERVQTAVPDPDPIASRVLGSVEEWMRSGCSAEKASLVFLEGEGAEFRAAELETVSGEADPHVCLLTLVYRLAYTVSDRFDPAERLAPPTVHAIDGLAAAARALGGEPSLVRALGRQFARRLLRY